LIDVHSHVLPGVDDGARGVDESIAMARAAARGGVTTIVATPHISDAYENGAQEIVERVSVLRTALCTAEVEITILPGGEVACGRLGRLSDDELAQVTIGGRSRYVLLEPPFRPLAGGGLGPYVRALHARGFRAVIAHAERCPDTADPERLLPLVRAGALAQVTAGSLLGEFGERPRQAARQLLDAGLAHVIASDAHGLDGRLTSFAGLSDALAREPELAAMMRPMTEEIPARLIADDDVTPDVPSAVPRRRRGALGSLLRWS
jgi:protein-tyrosine phosphatase